MAAGPGLEIGRNDRFQRLEWRVQRIGWAAIGLALLAAVLGLFGSTHFGEKQIASPDGSLRIEFLRHARRQAQAPLTLAVRAAGAELRVRLPVAYLTRMDLQRVEPRPERVTAAGGTQIFTFAAMPSEAARIVFHFRPDTFGRVQGRVGIVGGPELEFRQFVHP